MACMIYHNGDRELGNELRGLLGKSLLMVGSDPESQN
jgi:hypothetical protein